MTNALSTLVGPIIRNGSSWNLCVVGADDCVYGIPYYDAGHNAGQVIRFNPLDNSLTEIGPILDNGDGDGIESGWSCSVLAGNDCIYCIPSASNSRGVLKIDTINGTVTLLDVELPRTRYDTWDSGALAIDGCIYFMPGNNALRILKLNPENDTVSSVGQCVRTEGDVGVKYGRTVVGADNCLYGIPNQSTRILRFDPVNQTVTSMWPKGKVKYLVECVFRGCGVLGRDGHIYALDKGNMNWKMVGGILSIRVLKIDISNNDWSIVGNMPIYSDHDHVYSNCILGSDGCIYWPPGRGTHFLKFDPKTKHLSFVGGDLGQHGVYKWTSGALAPDGAIYCMPDSASQVLCIDPFKEFTTNLNDNMEQHPEELGFLFRKNSTIVGETMYESSIRKFGEKASNAIEKALEDCIQDNELFEKMNFHPFMIAASLENSELSVVYYLLRGDPSMFNVYVV